MNDKNPIIYVARISETAVLAVSQTDYVPAGKETILLDGIVMQKPYLLAKLQSNNASMLGLILHLPENNLLNAVENITFVANEQQSNSLIFAHEIDDSLTHLDKYLKLLSPSTVAKILYLLLQFSNHRPSLMLSQSYWLICNKVRQFLRPNELQAKHSVWLLPNLLFIPAQLPENINWNKAKLMLCSQQGLRFNEVIPVISPNNNDAIGLLVPFNNTATAMRPDESMTLFLRDQAMAISSPPPAIKDLSESKINNLIAHLQKQDDAKIFAMLGGLSQAIANLANVSAFERNELQNIVQTLQLYLPSSHSSVADFSKPFGFNIEIVAPIKNAGVLIAGWIFDPLQMFDHINIIDDCGNYYVSQHLAHRFSRPDAEKLYEDSAFANKKQNNQYGFIMWLENDAKMLVQPCAIRAELQLKSGLSYAITTSTKPANPAQMQSDLLKIVGSHLINYPKAMQFLAAKLALLQQEITKNITAQTPVIEYFGKQLQPKTPPLYSVIIPLYQRLEFVQAQLACFAADGALAKAEIIYVLDSPAQAEFLRGKLQQFSALYNIAITLLIMPENGGYANASNAGAKIARGEWLVMMNSDILPQSQGWAQIMSDFLLENPKIGVVAPKLLYEDDSIQHAGMYFASDSRNQFYENKHYYKGYPSSYASANKPRCTPAVTAACIMINRKLFTKMGMFTTDFVVGDYEDSDLCLKLFQDGYHCYYLPSVQMLHFERQSMNEHESATNARYYVNAWLHQQKWSSTITELMKQY